MKEKNEDMSDESLVEKFEERHAGDRKDWTTELNAAVEEMNSDELTSEISAEVTADF